MHLREPAAPLPRRFTAQALANTIWALATLRHCPPAPWFAAFTQQVQAQLQFFNPAGLGQLFFGMGVLGHKPSEEVAAALLQRVGALAAGAAARCRCMPTGVACVWRWPGGGTVLRTC